jgi:predicted 2-oxoglutarate/Fe(II)-dependent dioxygenase YbiX
MRASLLDKTIRILEERRTTSETGAQKKEYVEIHKIKAHKRKLAASVGDGVNASEVFIANTLVLQVRKYPFLNESMRMEFEGNTYEVILLDPQRDNTYLVNP